MSTHYLVDLFDDSIKAVRVNPTSGRSTIVGNYVVRLPTADVITSTPTNLASLLSQKYASALASNGGFTNIIYDDLLDASNINVGASTSAAVGLKGSVAIPAFGGTLQTVMTSLTTTPSSAVLTYEVFEYIDSDPKDDIFTRVYAEVAATQVTVQASFNNGSTYQAVSDQILHPIDLADQGNQLILKFTNASSPQRKLYLGSWALMY